MMSQQLRTLLLGLSLLLIASPLYAFPSPQRPQRILAFDAWIPTRATRRFYEKKTFSPSSSRRRPKLQSSSTEELEPDYELTLWKDAEDDRKLIRISSEIELPFSAEIAYEAYSDLPRQPSWSSWLESVQVLTDSKSTKVESKWTSRMMGIRYSWTAEAVRNVRPHTIQWRSITGLRNEGIVKFTPLGSKGYDEGPTLMTLQMAFRVPRAVQALVKRSKRISRFVEETMIAQSLQDFRDTVVENDLAKENEKTKSSTVL